MTDSLTQANELEFILRHATGKNRLAEVGVCWGGTSKELRRVMAPTATLFLVDPFYPTNRMTWQSTDISCDYSRALANVTSVQNGSAVFLRMESKDAAKSFVEPTLDFVFIDGDHSESSVRLDWRSWQPVVKPGGVILFHDVSSPHPGVLKVYAEALATPGWREIGVCNSVRALQKE